MFGSIVNEGYLNSNSGGETFCIYNRNPSACSYGVTVGVLAFLTCLLYLALDVYFPQISSVKDRKKAVLSDIGVSGESPAPVGAPWLHRACRGPSSHLPSPAFQMRRCRWVRGPAGVTWLAAGSGGSGGGPESLEQPSAPQQGGDMASCPSEASWPPRGNHVTSDAGLLALRCPGPGRVGT